MKARKGKRVADRPWQPRSNTQVRRPGLGSGSTSSRKGTQLDTRGPPITVGVTRERMSIHQSHRRSRLWHNVWYSSEDVLRVLAWVASSHLIPKPSSTRLHLALPKPSCTLPQLPLPLPHSFCLCLPLCLPHSASPSRGSLEGHLVATIAVRWSNQG